MTLDNTKRFDRDRHRLLSSRAFRRLAGKTQVVSLPNDPLIRTRLTHTLEVSSIAREIGQSLRLIDPLVDAIALGHDLGHSAFGHAGERALSAIVPGGFHHAAQGVRLVTELEPGLDLTPEVVSGILMHSKGRGGSTFARGPALTRLTREALVVRAADLFAYACHDLDDAYLLGALTPRDLPRRVREVLGTEASQIRQSLAGRTIRSSLARGDVSMDSEAEAALKELRAFLYERLYEGPRLARQTAFVRSLFESLWEFASADWGRFVAALVRNGVPSPLGQRAEAFVDALASMTDRQVLSLGRAVGLPRKARSLPALFSPAT